MASSSGRRSPPRAARRARGVRAGGPPGDSSRRGGRIAAVQPWSRDSVGRFDEHTLESEALRGNRLGDPHVRPLWVYLPPGAGETPLPSVYLLQGHTGQLDMWRNRSAFRPSVPELVDSLFAEEGCPPANRD